MTTLVLIKTVERLFQKVLRLVNVKIDCTLKKLVESDFVMSIDTCISGLQAVEQGFTILNLVETLLDLFLRQTYISITV